MLWSRRVEGIWTQGDADYTDAMVTSFILEYGSSEDDLFTYARDSNSPHVSPRCKKAMLRDEKDSGNNIVFVYYHVYRTSEFLLWFVIH